MNTSSRREALTIGLFASSLFGLIGRAFGQKTADEKPPPPKDAVTKIGTVRVGAIFSGVDKIAAKANSFKAEIASQKKVLAKAHEKAQREAEFLATLKPGSAAHAECEAKIAKMKAEAEALRLKSEEEFSKREADILAEIYKEVQVTVGVVARKHGLSLVFRITDHPEPQDLKSVMSNIEQSLLYAESSMDITSEVIAKMSE